MKERIIEHFRSLKAHRSREKAERRQGKESNEVLWHNQNNRVKREARRKSMTVSGGR